MSGATYYITYLFPLVIVGGMVAYYLLIYRKGKAAGGGLMEGFAVAAREKWMPVLPPDESITVTGTGFLYRPAWQAFFAAQVPALRLLWPVVSFQLVLTDHGRLGVAKYTMLGGLKDHKAYPPGSFGLERATAEKAGLATKLNPLAQAVGAGDWVTYDVTLALADGRLRLSNVPECFVQGLGASAPQGVVASA